jgi:hypothetical protein
MEFFEFTFNEGDTFKHSFKEIEKYVKRNVKRTIKSSWKPKILIQVYKDRTQVELEKGLHDLSPIYSQTLSIKLFDGIHLLGRTALDIQWDSNGKVWIVKKVFQPFW